MRPKRLLQAGLAALVIANYSSSQSIAQTTSVDPQNFYVGMLTCKKSDSYTPYRIFYGEKCNNFLSDPHFLNVRGPKDEIDDLDCEDNWRWYIPKRILPNHVEHEIKCVDMESSEITEVFKFVGEKLGNDDRLVVFWYSLDNSSAEMRFLSGYDNDEKFYRDQLKKLRK